MALRVSKSAEFIHCNKAPLPTVDPASEAAKLTERLWEIGDVVAVLEGLLREKLM